MTSHWLILKWDFSLFAISRQAPTLMQITGSVEHPQLKGYKCIVNGWKDCWEADYLTWESLKLLPTLLDKPRKRNAENEIICTLRGSKLHKELPTVLHCPYNLLLKFSTICLSDILFVEQKLHIGGFLHSYHTSGSTAMSSMILGSAKMLHQWCSGRVQGKSLHCSWD